MLVHKLASLLQLEDVKHEQLLMLTFSRAAATEFKERLIELIGNAAYFVEIKTFHSYCFDLLGKVGSLEKLRLEEDIVGQATAMIRDGDVEMGQVTRTVLVVDEAQDINETEYGLIKALMEKNEDMRVVAVGDDDQNIYGFRGSDSRFLRTLITEYGAAQYELLDNYRSSRRVVAFANAYAETMQGRMKRHPIRAVKEEEGAVSITRYFSRNMEMAVAEAVKKHVLSGRAKESGDACGQKESICILTARNSEALIIATLLEKQNLGCQVEVIRGNEDKDFDLRKLAEFDFFIRRLRKISQSPVISEDNWKYAAEQLNKYFKKSKCLTLCIRLLEQFHHTNKTMYLTDLEGFLHESKLEHAYDSEGKKIIVSTIHKAKGREFSSVYLMLRNYAAWETEEKKRVVYVACTRAQKELHIHVNDGSFDSVLKENACKYSENKQNYPQPGEVLVQLSHGDVHLGMFKYWEDSIRYCRSGQELSIDGSYLYRVRDGEKQKVLKFSERYLKKMEELEKKGYYPFRARVRYIVMWKGKEEEKEVPIILPDVHYNKK